MQRRDHREGEAKHAQPGGHDQVRAGGVGLAQDHRQRQGNGGEDGAPEPRLRHFPRQAIGAAANDRGGDGLHQPIGDGPGGDEARHLREPPAMGVEVNRQAHHEPDIAGAEQKHPRRRHQVDGAGLGEQLPERPGRLGLAQFARQAERHTCQHDAQQAGHQPEGTAEAERLQQQTAEEEADALHRVLGPREPGNPFEQLAGTAVGGRLDRGFGRGLGEVLRHPGNALRCHHPGDGQRAAPGWIERGEQQEAQDLQAQPGHQHARNAEARRQPAAAEIGEDAGELIQYEQRGQHERRVAQRVEVQQHQHAQGAVRQGEAPITCRNDQIIAQSRHHTPRSATILARSTMRQA